MVRDATKRRSLFLVAACAAGLTLAGCSGVTNGFVSTRTQGYSIPDSGLQQIRPGQSAELVIAVLGSPQTTNSIGDETAFYYVETKVERTAFGLTTPKERRVLAVYFDKKNKVSDKALYSLADGKFVTLETRRTPSFGSDRTFIESIISSF
jgi:outer membrane protein assembly factor BamE (lipoprotein component of BamABCDE complex)